MHVRSRCADRDGADGDPSARAVVSPGIARTTEQLVALNAVTGWILSVGLVVAPAAAGLILAVSEPGAVYGAGAGCLLAAALLVVPLRDLVPPLARDVANTTRGAVTQLEEGARMLARSTASREVVIVLTATFLMIGAFDVLAVVLALGPLGIGGSGAGYLPPRTEPARLSERSCRSRSLVARDSFR